MTTLTHNSGSLKDALDTAIDAFNHNVTISPTLIKGEPIVVDITLNDATLATMIKQKQEIKYFLIEKLVKAMYASGKYIEFTRQEMPHKNETVFRARIFVTPGDITQLLRTEGVIK